MIASVYGPVLETRIDGLVVGMGGLGIFVICAPNVVAAARIGENVTLSTSLIVREDSLTLFGFESSESRELFELIQGVNGFGPKLAFTVLATMSPDDLRSAIAHEDVARLKMTPGVGAKGAQRLVLELKDRVGIVAPARLTGWQNQVEQALLGLGYSGRDVTATLTTLAQDHQGTDDIQTLLKRALALLGKS